MTESVVRDRLEPAPGVGLALTVRGGPATGRLPVLLLHGLSQQQAFWDPVVRRMHTRPVAALDQRGHGASDTGLDVDYSVAACADDARAVLDHLGWSTAVVVGHSWGAAVALSAAARHPDRFAAAVLVDGGLWSPGSLGPRAEVRARLTPPRLGIPADELWAMVRQGDLGPSWSDEVEAALSPTFVEDDAGLVRTRLGMDRHMAVLDGLLDNDGIADLAACAAAGTPVWAAVCEPARPEPRDGTGADERATLREESVRIARGFDNCRVLRWAGAVHDVPLQWPALVAGFVDAAVESREGRTA